MAKDTPKAAPTSDDIRRICDLLRRGHHVNVACAHAGIPLSRHSHWMKVGRASFENDEDSIFSRYVREVDKAMASAEDSLLSYLQAAQEDDWKAAAWQLERRFPDRWGRKDKSQLQITGADEGPIQISILGAEERATLLSTLTANMAVPPPVFGEDGDVEE